MRNTPAEKLGQAAGNWLNNLWNYVVGCGCVCLVVLIGAALIITFR